MINNQTNEEPTRARAMSKAQLAEAYGVSTDTLRRWLKPFALVLGKTGNILTPKQVQFIFEKLGEP